MNKFQQEALANIVCGIFEAELDYFQRQIDKVITENKELMGPDTADGFIYMDKWYSNTNMRGRANQSLHPSLYPTMARLVSHRKNVGNDRQIVTQVLGRLISSYTSYQDIRNEVPECVVDVNPYLNAWQRTREPAQSIQNDPRALRQYKKVLTKIESYCAMRFLV